MEEYLTKEQTEVIMGKSKKEFYRKFVNTEHKIDNKYLFEKYPVDVWDWIEQNFISKKNILADRARTLIMSKIADIFNKLNTELEGKKQNQKEASEKLYYNAQQLILLEFYQEILNLLKK